MKLKTVPKIRTDCILCNGDSSVRQVVSGQSSMSRATCGERSRTRLRGKSRANSAEPYDSFHSLRINSVEPIREGGNKTAAGRLPNGEAYRRLNHFGGEHPCHERHVVSVVEPSGVVEVGMPQREVLRNNTGTRISLCGNDEVVGRWSLVVGGIIERKKEIKK